LAPSGLLLTSRAQ